MTNPFARQGAAARNDMNRSLGALLGIAQGLVCDQHLNDCEISFLQNWLASNEAISHLWPGDLIYSRVNEVLADGVVTESERDHLLTTLQQLIGGTLEELVMPTHVSALMFDSAAVVTFAGRRFCLTGDFFFAPKATCGAAIERRGGEVTSNVSKKVDYLVVGSRGSIEWKHGSFGTKVEKAMELKQAGAPISVIPEDHWAASLSVSTPV